jgi:hypothetical protein
MSPSPFPDGRPGPSRRRLLQGLLGGGALAASGLWPGPSRASGIVQRVVFFYFPDGVIGPSQDGQASKWHCTGGGSDFALSELLAPLADWRDRCVFLNGLSMGGTDSGSHPGGAKKLLTAADYGNNESIDQYLSRTAGAAMPWRHLYLGAQANADGASGDKHISYPVAGTSYAPEDDPRRAFSAIFGHAPAAPPTTDENSASINVLNDLGEELSSLQARVGATERQRLQVHLDSLDELAGRFGGGSTGGGGDGGGGGGTDGSCPEPSVEVGGITDATLYDPAAFPAILEAQLDIATLALACGHTRVVTVQGSHHTSELVMSRFPGTEMHDPSYDMRSHQASHYGASHDESKREYLAFAQQRRWWVERYAGLLARLARTEAPEGGSLLDSTAVVLCTEVCDGNTHLHDDMPFVVAGGESGGVRTGQLLWCDGRRHGDLWVALAAAMGADPGRFGDASSGALPGLVG